MYDPPFHSPIMEYYIDVRSLRPGFNFKKCAAWYLWHPIGISAHTDYNCDAVIPIFPSEFVTTASFLLPEHSLEHVLQPMQCFNLGASRWLRSHGFYSNFHQKGNDLDYSIATLNLLTLSLQWHTWVANTPTFGLASPRSLRTLELRTHSYVYVNMGSQYTSYVYSYVSKL